MHFIPINYSDPGFNPAYTADFQLTILLSSESFSYAIRHPVTHALVRVSTGNDLKELFDPQENNLFTVANYQKVIFAVDTKSFCLIPDAIFTPENLLDFAAFLSVKEADLILTDQLDNGENTVVFTFPKKLIRQIEVKFPLVKIQFAPKSWIKTVFSSTFAGQHLYLFLTENSLQILFPEQKNINFYNQFFCSTLDELVYFTALVASQLKLIPEETTLVLSGRVEDNGEQMLRLKRFFKDVLLFTSPDYQQRDLLQQHQVINFLGLS